MQWSTVTSRTGRLVHKRPYDGGNCDALEKEYMYIDHAISKALVMHPKACAGDNRVLCACLLRAHTDRVNAVCGFHLHDPCYARTDPPTPFSCRVRRMLSVCPSPDLGNGVVLDVEGSQNDALATSTLFGAFFSGGHTRLPPPRRSHHCPVHGHCAHGYDLAPSALPSFPLSVSVSPPCALLSDAVSLPLRPFLRLLVRG